MGKPPDTGRLHEKRKEQHHDHATIPPLGGGEKKYSGGKEKGEREGSGSGTECTWTAPLKEIKKKQIQNRR